MPRPDPTLLQLVRADALDGEHITAAVVASALEHRLGSRLLTEIELGRAEARNSEHTILAKAELMQRTLDRRFWAVLEMLDEQFRELGVGWIVLKGVATSARWYGRLGARPCSDLDILLAPGDLHRVPEVVAALSPSTRVPASTLRCVMDGTAQHIDLRFGGVAVDLHFDFLKLGIPTRQASLVWDTATLLPSPTLVDLSVQVVAPELELVQLLLHQNKDGFSYLGPMLDVRQIALSTNLDFAMLADFVLAEGLEVPFWSSARVISEITRLPFGAVPQHGPRALLWRSVWSDSRRLAGHEGRRAAPVRQRLLPLTVRRRPRDVAAEMRRQVAPPQGLLELAALHSPVRSHRSRLRRLTIDRLSGLHRGLKGSS